MQFAEAYRSHVPSPRGAGQTHVAALTFAQPGEIWWDLSAVFFSISFPASRCIDVLAVVAVVMVASGISVALAKPEQRLKNLKRRNWKRRLPWTLQLCRLWNHNLHIITFLDCYARGPSRMTSHYMSHIITSHQHENQKWKILIDFVDAIHRLDPFQLDRSGHGSGLSCRAWALWHWRCHGCCFPVPGKV